MDKPKGSRKRKGTASYITGRERLESILEAAKDILIAEGYQNFSMRLLAEKAGINVGNIVYYYHNKNDLMADLLEKIVDEYLESFRQTCKAGSGDAIDQLDRVIELMIDDTVKSQNAFLFGELWMMANRQPFAGAIMDRYCRSLTDLLTPLVRNALPHLDPPHTETLILMLISTVEGLQLLLHRGNFDKSNITLAKEMIRSALHKRD